MVYSINEPKKRAIFIKKESKKWYIDTITYFTILHHQKLKKNGKIILFQNSDFIFEMVYFCLGSCFLHINYLILFSNLYQSFLTSVQLLKVMLWRQRKIQVQSKEPIEPSLGSYIQPMQLEPVHAMFRF